MSSDEILTWSRSTHDPFAGAWEQILALVQAHPEWTSTQILQGIGQQVSSPSAPSSIWTLMQRLGPIRQRLRTTWEEPWPTELIQGGNGALLPTRSQTSDQAMPVSGQHCALTPVAPVPASDPPSDTSTRDLAESSTEEQAGPGQPTDPSPPARPLAPPLLAQAIAAFLQEMRELGRKPQTLAWHQTSLFALQQYVWDQFQLIEVRQLSQAVLQRWVSDLHTARSAQTGAALAVNTIAAYARSGRASTSGRGSPRSQSARPCCGIPTPSAFCRLEGICMTSRNSLGSLVPRLSGATSASVRNSGERNQVPRRLPGKPSLHGRPGEARANVGRREDEGESETISHEKCYSPGFTVTFGEPVFSTFLNKLPMYGIFWRIE